MRLNYCSVLIVLLIIIPSASLSAAELKVEELSEEEFFDDSVPIILTGTRLAQPRSDVPASMTVITRKMIEAAGVKELPEIFRLVPGFQVGHDRPGFGYRVGVTYHGNADTFARRMQVLVDGRSVYLPVFGGVNWYEIPLSIEDIERIEVTRGPNGVTFGSNSFAAVINIITIHPNTTQGTYTKIEANNNDFRKVYARHSNNGDNINYRLSIESQQDTGFDDVHDDKKRTLMNYRGEYRPSDQDVLEFQFGGLSAPEQTAANGPERDTDTRSYFEQVKWKRLLGEENEFSLQLYHNVHKHTDAYTVPLPLTCAEYAFLYGALGPGCVAPDGTPTFISFDQEQSAFSQRINLEYQHTKRLNKTLRAVWGAEAREDSVKAVDWLGTDSTIKNNLYRAFVNAEWSITDKLIINAGTMIEKSDLADNESSPRIALNFHLTPNHTFRASVSRAKRVASIFEAKGDVSVTLGTINTITNYQLANDGDIKPESITSYELGYIAKLAGNKLLLDVKLFKEVITDVITLYDNRAYPADLIDQTTDSFTNDGHVTIHGLELELNYSPDRKTLLALTYSLANNDGRVRSRVNADLSVDYEDTDTSTPKVTMGILAAREFHGKYYASIAYNRVGSNHWLGGGSTDGESYETANIRFKKGFVWNKTDGGVELVLQNALGSYQDTDNGNNIVLEKSMILSLDLQFD